MRGTFAYTYNVLSGDPASTFKNPVSGMSGRAGLEFQLNRRYAMELDYVYDAIDFEQVWRVANGAAFGFSTSF